MKSTEMTRERLLEALGQEIRKRAGGAAAEAEAYAQRFYSHVATEDLAARSLDELAGAPLSLLRLGERRSVGQVLARVFNPDPAVDGWGSRSTIIELVNDDMSFLVDSVTAALTRHGLEVRIVIHPVLRVRRSADGVFEGLAGEAGSGAGVAESHIHVEVDRRGGKELEEIREELLEVLARVRACVQDWHPMEGRLKATVDDLVASPPPLGQGELEETLEFLKWLEQDHFTFLGFREYDLNRASEGDALVPVPGSGLGLLRDDLRISPSAPRRLSAEMSAFARRPEVVFITKTNHKSPVHRDVHMDYIGIKRFGADGQVIGERRFQGLFTSMAYQRRAMDVPILRRKVRQVIDRAGLLKGSHDAKSFEHILETYPRDELFQMSVSELHEAATGILSLQERRRLALFLRKDAFERFIACMVFVPRDRYNTDLRRRIERILEEEVQGTIGAAYTQVSNDPLARVQVFLSTEPGKVPSLDVKAIERRLAAAMRTWQDEVRDAALSGSDGEQGAELFRRYEGAFPAAYREAFPPADVPGDLHRLEQVRSDGQLRLHLYRAEGEAEHRCSMKLYSRGELLPLSVVLPYFENLGFQVRAEMPYEVASGDAGAPLWVRDFELSSQDGSNLDLDAVRVRVEETFLRVWSGEIENDPFNRLVLVAGLGWREVMVLRAYARYLRQTNIAFSQETLAAALARNAAITRQLVQMFLVAFDPDGEDQENSAKEISQEVRTALGGVTNADEDRILRRFWNLIRSTLRTNFFQPAADGSPKPYVSFKLESQKVDELPLPRPLYETWVYSPRTEGIHLRGGMVARGGIRWSDRPEDFRTEILSLMKTQMVKNAVIVPVGAKGGFIVKRPPADPAALGQEGVECYRYLVRGLLDIVDNYHGDRVVPPSRVVRRDGNDPYLVVAADKGTAKFSDIANALAEEYGFWLGDAFASGGKTGYDHKGMAITSRGGWEAVKRHFREMGHDTQAKDFTVVGVGDMSGDVFGNGMLRSPHIRLLGAFDHRHIFVDPNPDGAASFRERKRMFDLPRSSWMDYDRSLISAGGGVFERNAREIVVSPEMKKAFDLSAETVTPTELMRAILKAEADLLWFGGIGTYVKSSSQSHADAKDRPNDGLRIDATEIRAKVIGEGANLALTQEARVEYALHGGRINTDAIDNSGGVDCSDHEVNIKILFGAVEAEGGIRREERDRLLESMTEEVADLVLRDNYLQTQAITVVESARSSALDRQARFMRDLERAGKLDRRLEGLPSDEELADREADGKALTRPEIAVLLAYSKIVLYSELLASDLPDDPLVADDLVLYFPVPLREPFIDAIRRHRLRREITATAVTNSMVNRVGPTFVHRLQSATAASAADVARAYSAVRDAFDLRWIWGEIEALDNKVEAELQTEMIAETKELVERTVPWLLRRRFQVTPDSVANLRVGIVALSERLGDLLMGRDKKSFERRLKKYEKGRVPGALARRVASLDFLGGALDIVRLATERGLAVDTVAGTYFLIGERFGYDWLREQGDSLVVDTPWQREARAAMIEELYGQQGTVTGSVLGANADGGKAALESWAEQRGATLDRVRRLLTDLRSEAKLDLAMLSVARHQLAELAAG